MASGFALAATIGVVNTGTGGVRSDASAKINK